MIQIIPAILEKDFSGLEAKLQRLEKEAPEIKLAQIDIMDGKFVPNTTDISPEDLYRIQTRNLRFELHLMVELIGGEDPHTFVLGLISHDQWQKLCEELPVQADKVDILERWVGIVYSPIRREGNAFLSRKLHNLLLETGLE